MEVWMRTFHHLVAATLTLGLASSAAAQPRHVVDPAAVAGTARQHAVGQEQDRAAIREALARPEVRSVAAKTGVDLGRLSAAVDTLPPSDLARAAAAARDVNQSLVGGASTVTISTTAIIIGLLVLILLIVALD
jgi:hypothetical protein